MNQRDEFHGHIEVICGSMFSGKSEELIRRVKRASIARQKIQVFAHRLDTRYGEAQVASHNGSKLIAIPVQNAQQISELAEPDTQVIAVDEAQFFDWTIADVANGLAARGVRVILAGLDTDFRGEPFGPMPLLMAQAEDVEKLNAICVVCGQPASRTQRLVNGKPAYYDDPVVVVGASEMYEARCRQHHVVPHKVDSH
ncbi:MAG TPA: thymidine kinase [Anaerolineae bacterium]